MYFVMKFISTAENNLKILKFWIAIIDAEVLDA